MKQKFLFSVVICLLIGICLSSVPMAASYTYADEVDITSKSAYLMDYSSGQVLYEKNATSHLPVASMVKMMTILLTLEEIDSSNLSLDTMITTSERASSMGGSQVFIDPYVEYSAQDLLKSVIMASANDASVALAEHISGSEKAFVDRMNKKAATLGMKDTNYVNCTGLPAPEQYSSAKDSAIILREVTGNKIYHSFSNIWMDELVHPSGRKTELVNTNRLIRYYQGCDSGKTGSTNEAGCCLSASATRDGMRLISVIVGAENSQKRFNECSSLFNYGFANFENKNIIDCDKVIQEIPVSKGKESMAKVYSKECFSAVVKKGDKLEYNTSIHLPEKIKAPLKNGDSVGKITISKEGNIIKEIDLIVKIDIEKLGFKDCIDRVVEKW